MKHTNMLNRRCFFVASSDSKYLKVSYVASEAPPAMWIYADARQKKLSVQTTKSMLNQTNVLDQKALVYILCSIDFPCWQNPWGFCTHEDLELVTGCWFKLTRTGLQLVVAQKGTNQLENSLSNAKKRLNPMTSCTTELHVNLCKTNSDCTNQQTSAGPYTTLQLGDRWAAQGVDVNVHWSWEAKKSLAWHWSILSHGHRWIYQLRFHRLKPRNAVFSSCFGTLTLGGHCFMMSRTLANIHGTCTASGQKSQIDFFQSLRSYHLRADGTPLGIQINSNSTWKTWKKENIKNRWKITNIPTKALFF